MSQWIASIPRTMGIVDSTPIVYSKHSQSIRKRYET